MRNSHRLSDESFADKNRVRRRKRVVASLFEKEVQRHAKVHRILRDTSNARRNSRLHEAMSWANDDNVRQDAIVHREIFASALIGYSDVSSRITASQTTLIPRYNS